LSAHQGQQDIVYLLDLLWLSSWPEFPLSTPEWGMVCGVLFFCFVNCTQVYWV
jgi:hypothetical protein